MEGFIDDYSRLRVMNAITSLVVLAGVVLTGQRSPEVLVIALGLAVTAIHALWGVAHGVRSPRFALALDMTVLGAATSVSIALPISGVVLALWCVLITFLTDGRSRQLFFGYAIVWYLIDVSRMTPPQRVEVTMSVVFIVGLMGMILITVKRRMEMLEVQRSQLLGSVSHELRNQLTGVVGMIDLAFGKGSQADIDEIRDLVGLARREAVDAIAVIEDLLTASRMENNVLEMTPERIDIDLELSKIVDHYPTEGLSVELVNPQSGLLAWADQVRVRQVLRNLLSNAVRYGGNAISIGVQASDTLIRIQVCDDGGGVPTGEEETIFLAYRRATATRRHQSSVGLGLWISRRLARSMGGDLTYGRSNELTVFELSLPVFMPAPSASPNAGPAGTFDRESI